jgi:hypothetical protein
MMTQRILNWMLIALMVMSPLRLVWADGQPNCDMHDQSAEQHAEHHWHHSADANQYDVVDSGDCCCCDSSASCGSDCGFSIGASVILPSGIDLALSNPSSIRTKIVNDLVFREFSPPTRPPAYL